MDDALPAADVEKGFRQVDAQPDAALLVAGMEATAQWPAVQRLRAWEREHLAMTQGERLLDVGCGMADQAVAYALAGASVTAVDPSEGMLDAARERATRADVTIHFGPGDATALAFDSDTFDACRSERVLQWIPDMAAAIDEMRRVVRPGGRICAVDTDWRTLAADLSDLGLTRKLGDAFLAMRGPSAAAGGRLLNLFRDAGLVDVDCTADAHVWTRWDPTVEPNPPGLFPVQVVVPQLAELGLMTAEDSDALVDGLSVTGAADRFFMSLTMVAVCGRVPG